ncbi:MAG TPA: DMT family transporter [Herpetosiphonaceae bacterium]|nr:DMT family transporter [Herpetosiphonaceae bacterium]
MNKRTLAIVALVAVVSVWGSAVVATKSMVDAITPIVFALLRFVLASAILLPLAIRQHRRQPDMLRGAWGWLVASGILGVTVFYTLSNIALGYASATQGILVQSSIPVVTAIMAFALLGERLRPRQIGGIGLSLLGVLVVVLTSRPGPAARDPLLGCALMFCGVVAWSAYTIAAKRLNHLDQLVVTGYGTAVGTLALLPLAAFEQWGRPLPALGLDAWLVLLYLSVASTALGHLFYNRSLRELDASQAASYLNLMPVVGVAVAVLALGEPLVAWQLAGGAVVLAGVWLTS